MAVLAWWGEQVDHALEELQRAQQDLRAAVWSWSAQAVHQGVGIEAAQAAGGQGGSRAVTHQSLQALAVPVGKPDLGVHGPAAAVLPGAHLAGRGGVQVTVFHEPAQAAVAELIADARDGGLIEMGGWVEERSLASSSAALNTPSVTSTWKCTWLLERRRSGGRRGWRRTGCPVAHRGSPGARLPAPPAGRAYRSNRPRFRNPSPHGADSRARFYHTFAAPSHENRP